MNDIDNKHDDMPAMKHSILELQTKSSSLSNMEYGDNNDNDSTTNNDLKSEHQKDDQYYSCALDCIKADPSLRFMSYFFCMTFPDRRHWTSSNHYYIGASWRYAIATIGFYCVFVIFLLEALNAKGVGFVSFFAMVWQYVTAVYYCRSAAWLLMMRRGNLTI